MKNKRIIYLILFLLVVTCIVCYLVFYRSDHIDVYDYYSGEQREDVSEQDKIYLWDRNNMPTITAYTENNGNYFDEPDFRPFMTRYDVPEGVEVKGAMLISPGGAFMFRSEMQEGKNVALAFAQQGYVSFVVHYRVSPYTEEESGIDIARAVKYVRYHAKDYGISEDHIGVVGFSAGGIANGHAVLEFGGDTNGKVLDSNYQPDHIDKVDATPNAVVMGYSFYGRLSVADLDEDTFDDFDLPPTYYVYGTEDPFYDQFNAQVDLLKNLNKNIEVNVLDHYPHGFGSGGNWIQKVDLWLDQNLES